MKRWPRSVRRLVAVLATVSVTVALSIGVVVSLAVAQTTTDTEPDTTTTTTPPETTPTTTTTTPPDQGVITPPDSTPPATPPDTTPDTTPTTPGPTTTEPTTALPPLPPPPPPDLAAGGVNDQHNDIFVGTVTTLSAVQRAAIEAFLAATGRLGRAQTALATAKLTPPPPPPTEKPDVVRPAHASPSSAALFDSALALDRAVKRVALRAHETLGISASAPVAEPPTPTEAAQAEVDAAQADLDHATDDLRGVANGDPLITTLLTGKPPAGDGLAQQIAAAQAGQGNPPALDGIFAFPVPGAPIVSPYGFRIDPLGSNVGFHPGIDISATQGTPILAAAPGTVIVAGDEGGYGNAVILDHGDSLSTLYGHMVRVAVSPGQHVETGDVIGYVGSTGLSTGPHCHFEVRIHGVTVDPLGTFKS